MSSAAKKEKQPKQKKAVKTAITPTRGDNFPEWYQQVIKAADMAENAPVRGCMIIKPYGYALWENIQKHLDKKIKAADVQNAYFPLLIPLNYIAKEAEHIDGFAKECAVVTHSRLEANAAGELVPSGELEEPFIIRPTSETIIGESMSRWVQSYRDLPLKLNQWANVMRWEMRPRVFLRTSEFLWQEGHNAFATNNEAYEDTLKMLNIYRELYEDYMAIPGIAGAKTPDERFPGAIDTYTFESFMQDGKALQACTSHHLGQTFSKSADITFSDKDGEVKHAYTTSWGLSTRSIGGLIMIHADDDGMVMPPKIAPYQVAIIPVIRNEEDRELILEHCSRLEKELNAKGVTAKTDTSDQRTPNKMWNAIKKGVPVRVEIGAREIEERELTYARRDLGKEGKKKVPAEDFLNDIPTILEDMQADMFERAKRKLEGLIHDVDTLDEIREFYENGKKGGVRIDYKLIQDSEEYEEIRKQFSLTPRCLPFEDDGKKVIISKAY